MQILFDQGVYDMRNKGNVALLQAAVERLSKAWPGASLKVITAAPYLLKLYCPNARPVSPDGQYDWFQQHSLVDEFTWRLPTPALRMLFEAREAAWRRWPTAGSPLKAVKQLKALLQAPKSQQAVVPPPNEHLLAYNGDGQPAAEQRGAFAAMQGVDLFVATGAQYMSDACKDDALRVLDRLEAAFQLGIPTAMLGQGMGPIEDPELRMRAQAVLPRVDLILVRERFATPQLLQALGVAPSRIIFTSDDAIEMAYRIRPQQLGTGIGVSVRMAPYTQVGGNQLDFVRPLLAHASTRYKAKLMAVPISHSAHELDDQMLRELLAGQANAVHSRWRFNPPVEVIKTVGRCRLVVTGTFHTAVFALSQGIPAVALAKSTMYMDKFVGLADQFGPGCQAIDLGENGAEQKVATAIDAAWEMAERVRPQLLEAAVRQIELGHAGYRRVYALVGAKNQANEMLIEKELA